MRLIRYGKLQVAFALLFLLISVAPAGAAPKVYNIDFSDVDVRQVIETVSEITGKNFLVDDRVQGRVTVIGPKSLTSGEIYQVFLSILQVKGYTLVPAGKINKIVPVANVKSYGLDMKVGKTAVQSNLDQYVTQIIPVEYTSAEELRNLIQPLMPKTDSIVSYGPTNLLIITTTESVLSRLNRIISVVDIPGAREEVRIIPVFNAQVADLASKLNLVMESQTKPQAAARRAARGQPQVPAASVAQIRIIPDERTNTIIAIGDLQNLKRVEDLVKKLDAPVQEGASGRVHVYYLQNADATELASVLMGIPLQDSLPQPMGTPAKTLPAQARAGTKRTDISIIADAASNALVITATSDEFAAIKTVIEKLDLPREQVLVEVLIAEVGFTKTMELGVEWRIADDFDGEVVGFAGSSFGQLDQISATFPATPSGLVVGAIGETITFGDLEFPNLGALIRALKSDSDINILSTPTIVTTDNTEAEIIVGQTVPFQTSQKFDSNNQPVFTFDYRDVGLTLRLTPQINSNKFIKLDIFSKLEALVASTVGTQELAPTTLKRQANTTVVVKDGQTVIIGGMIRDDKIETVSSVPFLGKIPVLGALFRSSSTTEEKVNLLIFLTPRIISSSEQWQEMARERSGILPPVPDEIRKRMNIDIGGQSQ